MTGVVGCLVAAMVLWVHDAPASEKKTEDGPTYASKHLREWLAQLESKNADEQKAAAEAIQMVVQSAHMTLPQVARLLRHESEDVRVAAIKLLPAYGELAVPVLSATLWDEEPAMRLGAMLALRQMKTRARGAVPALTARLNDSEPLNRSLAAEMLGDLGLRSAVPALRGLLKNQPAQIRGLAINALVKLDAVDGQVITSLTELLDDDDETVRVPASQLLGRLGRSARDAVPDLIEAARDPSLEVRKQAVQALGKIGVATDEVSATLDRMLRDEVDVELLLTTAESHWRLRKRPEIIDRLKPILEGDVSLYTVDAARLLWRINRSPQTITVLGKVLGGGKEVEQHKALLVLGHIGPRAKAVLREVTALLDSPSTGVRAESSWVLGRFGKHAAPALPKLEALAEDANPWVRLHSLHSSWRISPDDKYITRMVPYLDDRDEQVREGTARLLRTLGPEAKRGAEGALVKALADRHPRVRHAAAHALWEICKHPDALKTMIELLDHEDADIREMAAANLGVDFKGEAKKAVPYLIRLLWDVDNRVRANAAEALGRIGPDAKAAIPALTAALAVEESPDNVHSAAAEALGLMGPDARQGVSVLRKQLRHPSSYVRALAGKSLWILAEHPEAVPVLKAELNDYHPEARIAAAEGLWLARQEPRAIAVLVQVLEEHIDVSIPPTHENLAALANHRYMAARALGRIGPAAKEALPVLRDLLDDEDADLTDAISDAVKKIESSRK